MDPTIKDFEAALLELTRDYPAFSLVSFAQWRAEQVAGNQARTNILYMLMAALALPSLLALANTLGINVLERTRELGLLRALGATRGQVQRIIIAESLLLAALGVLGGALAGVGLGYALFQLSASTTLVLGLAQLRQQGITLIRPRYRPPPPTPASRGFLPTFPTVDEAFPSDTADQSVGTPPLTPPPPASDRE